MNERPTERVARVARSPLVVYAVAMPLGLLAMIYATSLIAGVVFGNIIFWLTPLMVLLWVFHLWRGRRQGPGSDRDASLNGSGVTLSLVALVITITVMAGWVGLAIEFFLLR